MRKSMKYEEECNDDDYRKRSYNEMSTYEREVYYPKEEDRWNTTYQGYSSSHNSNKEFRSIEGRPRRMSTYPPIGYDDHHHHHSSTATHHYPRSSSSQLQQPYNKRDYNNKSTLQHYDSNSQVNHRPYHHHHHHHHRSNKNNNYYNQEEQYYHHHHQEEEELYDTSSSVLDTTTTTTTSELLYPYPSKNEERSGTTRTRRSNSIIRNNRRDALSSRDYSSTDYNNNHFDYHSHPLPSHNRKNTNTQDIFRRSNSNPDSWEAKRERRYEILNDLEPAPISSGHVFDTDVLDTTNSDTITDTISTYPSSYSDNHHHHHHHSIQEQDEDIEMNIITTTTNDDDHHHLITDTPSRHSRDTIASTTPATNEPNYITPTERYHHHRHSSREDDSTSSQYDYHSASSPSRSYHHYSPYNHHLHPDNDYHYSKSRISPPDVSNLLSSPSNNHDDEMNHDNTYDRQRIIASHSSSSSVPATPSPNRRKKGGLSNAWNDRYEELKTFKQIHGHCMVPQKYADNPPLGIWVNKQRMEHNLLQDGKKTSMTEDRYHKLKTLGFVWAKRKGMTTWNTKYEEMLSYRRKHGDCLVPTKYLKNPALGRWVSTQREQYRLLKEGKPTKMTPDKIALLESVGFVWRLQF